MKKTYKIDVDCANCANKMEEAANKTEGVKSAVVNFMTLKMKVEFEDGADPAEVMPRVLENCKIVEDDCEIFFD
ncbi:MAG: cation transporter [Lachnospiraceae bacterium]|nr:cation transporter [Lachnospiraceae bacterium]